MFGLFTLVAYLIVGTVAVRIFMPENVQVSIPTSILDSIHSHSLKKSHEVVVAEAPEMKFVEIKIPVEAKPIVKKVVKAVAVKTERKVEAVGPVRILEKNELPFHEPFAVSKVEVRHELETNLVALYKDFRFDESTLVAEVKDEVTTTLAAANEAEPEFFEYPTEPVASAQPEPVKTVEATKEEIKSEVKEEIVQEVVAAAEDRVEHVDIAAVASPAAPEAVTTQEPEFFDYPPVKEIKEEAKVAAKSEPAPAPALAHNLMAFDYSQANKDIANQTIPKVSLSNHKPMSKPKAPEARESEEINAITTKTVKKVEAYEVSLTIQAVGTDLKGFENIAGFEVRYQDDQSEATEDYGAGSVNLEMELSKPKMTRSITMLKRGFIPTSSEIILEEGTSSTSIPMIEEEVFNNLQLPYENRGSVGALLVELDDETDVAKVDVPFGDVIKLNGDFKKTKGEDFRYQLFVGVKAGNALLSYHRRSGEVVQKIVHVHEHEMTYDANFYEDVINEKVRIFEEDLLSKESSPLIITADQVRIFATEATSKKINDHTYKLPFGVSHLGGRRYIELNHQREPVFIGIRDNNNVTVPSEHFMRFILSNVEGAKLGNRCLVQINLDRKIEKVEVASESVSASLMTYVQMLDSDGKFYDSISEKTRKVIVIGESQGSSNVSPDAKINLKIQYTDGTVQFLNSYCSPNTYLVEQL